MEVRWGSHEDGEGDDEVCDLKHLQPLNCDVIWSHRGSGASTSMLEVL